ncbi:hypothetical protein SNEBB_002239 [Seison nebaliae]|nr:hypothetical protein SNEBB_002239 [Seison nebaliae]
MGKEDVGQFFDHRLQTKVTSRRPAKLFRGDVLSERIQDGRSGKYKTAGRKLRNEAKIKALQERIAPKLKQTGIETDANLVTRIRGCEESSQILSTVDNENFVEWWDKPLLCYGENGEFHTYKEITNNNDYTFNNCINSLIEHPIPLKSARDLQNKDIVIVAQLTDKERKKIRRQRRAEQLKEDQEKIRLGLLPPPEPKVRLGNLHRVLGTDAVQDPTKIEQYVRKQMANRKRAHEIDNQTRKLTKEQLRRKKFRKAAENLNFGTCADAYRIDNLTDPAHRFKIKKNIEQLLLTGIAVVTSEMSLIFVEGGRQQTRKMKHLLLDRIDWTHTVFRQTEKDKQLQNKPLDKNCCRLVWEGEVKERIFKDFKIKIFPSSSTAREFLSKYNIAHYWDVVQSDTMVGEIKDVL